jgi:hypothetical protein
MKLDPFKRNVRAAEEGPEVFAVGFVVFFLSLVIDPSAGTDRAKPPDDTAEVEVWDLMVDMLDGFVGAVMPRRYSGNGGRAWYVRPPAFFKVCLEAGLGRLEDVLA